MRSGALDQARREVWDSPWEAPEKLPAVALPLGVRREWSRPFLDELLHIWYMYTLQHQRNDRTLYGRQDYSSIRP